MRRASAQNISLTKQVSSMGVSVLVVLHMKNAGKPGYVLKLSLSLWLFGDKPMLAIGKPKQF